MIEYDEAIDRFDPAGDLSQWELGWYETCAEKLNRQELLEEIEKVRKNQRDLKNKTSGNNVLRPVVKGGLHLRDAGC